jgi:ATP-dependent exoDNAse (exonuclease V) alpha subunit
MARTYEELKAEFDFEKNVFGKDEDRTVVGVLVDGSQVKGKAREGELETGLTYLFRGFWTEHPKYGKQFQFYSFGVSQPVGQRGTVAYLTRGPGIGRKRAQLIWEAFGQGSLEAIRERPKEVAAAIAGLTEAKAMEAAAYFRAHKDREIVTRDLEELLAGGGFPRRLIDKLIERWGAKAAERIRANAYCLMAFRSVGFGRADKLFLRLGGRPDTPERLGWCAHNALHKDREGHSWRPWEFGRQAITKGVAGVDVVPKAGLEWAIQKHHIAIRRDEKGRQWIAEQERAGAERRLASEVHRAMVEGAE